MGRKNQSEEKREHILDAFETVILREGFANASQRKIAQEAGMNQPMIHHYFAGGDAMLEALLERITQRYRQALTRFSAQNDTPSLEQVLVFLSSEAFHEVSIQNEVMFRLIGQAHHHDEAIRLLSGVYHQMLSEIKTYLDNAKVENVEQVAYTLMCVIIGHDWAKTLGFGEHRNTLIQATLERLSH